MNEQILREYMNGTAIEDMDIVIYDCQIEGIKTMEEAKKRANISFGKMIRAGYKIIERNGVHYFVI